MGIAILQFGAFCIRRALQKPFPNSIPRSGPEAEKVDCFAIAIDKVDDPYLVVVGIDEYKLECLEWNGQRYEAKRNIELVEHGLSEFKIKHFFGLSEVTYFGLVDFAIGQTFKLPYCKIWALSRLAKADQYLFNKKKFHSKKRNDILKTLVRRTLDGEEEFSAMDLMTDLYSIRWFDHPNGESEMRKIEFYLKSLAGTNDLEVVSGYRYKVSDTALGTLEAFEELERKHTENVKLQRRMFWIALVVAALTFVQAGFFKVKPWFDQTSQSAK